MKHEALELTLRAELLRAAGWYDFADSINIASPTDLGGYPRQLVQTHELAHKALTEDTLYGAFVLRVEAMLQAARKAGLDEHTRRLERSSHLLIEGMLFVQEGIATHAELWQCGALDPALLATRAATLPELYREAFERIEGTLGKTRTSSALGLIQHNVAANLARGALDLDILKSFPRLEDVTPTSISELLATHSPNRRFIDVLDRLDANRQASAVLEKWNDLVATELAARGLEAGRDGEWIRYDEIGQPRVEELVQSAQTKFYDWLRQENLLPFEMLDGEDKLTVLEAHLASWRDHTIEPAFRETLDRMVVFRAKPPVAHRTIVRHYVGKSPKLEGLDAPDAALTADTLLEVIIRLRDLGRMPILSLEWVEQNQPVAKLLATLPSRTGNYLDYLDATLIGYGTLALEEFHRLTQSPLAEIACYPAPAWDQGWESLPPLLWHFDAALMRFLQSEDRGAFFGALPVSLGMITERSWSFSGVIWHINQRIEAGKNVNVRCLHFIGVDVRFIVANTVGTLSYYAWPCVQHNFEDLARHYQGVPSVTVGRPAILARYGDEGPTNELYALLSCAFGGESAANAAFRQRELVVFLLWSAAESYRLKADTKTIAGMQAISEAEVEGAFDAQPWLAAHVDALSRGQRRPDLSVPPEFAPTVDQVWAHAASLSNPYATDP